MFQRCLLVDATSRCGTTSNQRRINVVYFNADINNVRQRQNNVVILNVEFHKVGKRRNNVVKMNFSKNNKNKNISNRIRGIQSFKYYFMIFFTLLPMLRGESRRVRVKSRKFLKDHEKYCIARIKLNRFTLVQVHND